MHARRSAAFRFRYCLVVLAVLMVSAIARPPVEAQGREFGRVAVPVPDRSDAGSWEGTWYYVSRDMRMAVWFREGGKQPQVKIRFQGLNKTEAFTTDWDGQAEYEFRGKQGKFWMDFEQRDADTLSGSWNWTFGPEGDARIDTARFEMYRIGEGRHFALRLVNYERVYQSPGAETRLPRDQIRTFSKASRFQALWSELPF